VVSACLAYARPWAAFCSSTKKKKKIEKRKKEIIKKKKKMAKYPHSGGPEEGKGKWRGSGMFCALAPEALDRSPPNPAGERNSWQSLI
jgi:hypothetical protein